MSYRGMEALFGGGERMSWLRPMPNHTAILSRPSCRPAMDFARTRMLVRSYSQSLAIAGSFIMWLWANTGRRPNRPIVIG